MEEVKILVNALLDFYNKHKEESNNVQNKKGFKNTVPIGVSGRHVHLSKKDLEILFGQDYQLTLLKSLSQPGQYAAKEQVTLCGPKGVIEKVRVIGPVRKETQVEILQSDAFKLGVKPVIRLSGDIENTPGITIIGPKGSVIKDKGVIVAQRHIHMNLEQAAEYGLKDGDVVAVRVDGIRGGIMDNMIMRINESGYLDAHIDTEEANAFGLSNDSIVTIVR